MISKKTKNFFRCAMAMTLVTSCATSGSRFPASNEELTLKDIINQVKETSLSLKENPALCKTHYDELYRRLFEMAGDSVEGEGYDVKGIDSDIQASFLARIALKESFKNFNTESDCLSSATDVFRGLRYVEDYLIELRTEKTFNAPSEYVDLKGEFPYLLVNPKYAENFKSYEDLQSGDVILSRGNAFSSAAIARIAINDYQFSHLSFVYKDPDTKELLTTEAHIEIGSVVEPLIDHINSQNSRSVVFRYNDPVVANAASTFVHDRVQARQLKKDNIQYDFTMDFKDPERWFCSEIITAGFKHVLPNEDYFPMFKSKFSPGIIPFLNVIGVPVNKSNVDTLEVFAPGDLQFDPRFEIVAEWRNPKKMENSRMKDFILTKIFESMSKNGYQFDPNFEMSAKAKTSWLLRRLPVVKKYLASKFPLNMKPSQLELFMVLDQVGEAIYKDLEKASLEYERPMTPKEIFSELNDIFKRDLEIYNRYKKGQEYVRANFHKNIRDNVGVNNGPRPAFHLLFHP